MQGFVKAKLPAFLRLFILQKCHSCPVKGGGYIIPRLNEIPMCLRGLTKNEVLALRPFTLKTGNYKVHQHGYRQHDGFCRVCWSNETVLEKIAKLEPQSNFKCLLAYRYPTSPISRYNHYIELRVQHKQTGAQLNLYDYKENERNESPLRPNINSFHE